MHFSFKIPQRACNEKEKDDAIHQICPGWRSMTAENWEPNRTNPSADRMRAKIRCRSTFLPLFKQSGSKNWSWTTCVKWLERNDVVMTGGVREISQDEKSTALDLVWNLEEAEHSNYESSVTKQLPNTAETRTLIKGHRYGGTTSTVDRAKEDEGGNLTSRR